MAVRVKVVGTEQFEELARRLRETGNGAIAREMAKSLRASAEPAKAAAEQSVLGLPISGHSSGRGRAQREAYLLSRRKRVSARMAQRIREGAGLRASTANALRTEVTASARTARLRIKVQKSLLPPGMRKLPKHMNSGKWRHPVWGNREVWVAQTAPPHWFDDPMQTEGPQVRDAAQQVVSSYLKRL
ncbi:hypothetical protein [Allokutzneria albata]|uniref:Uncharacterized protein n=1 Tax=Allokutzneria albata TaxID=211114 RepID=A0A1H0DV71_ALLAB|nr:hypothetical protein [Allokutzneria albata]SDN73881.1 hypothetical protein SAMN04489726_8005 [Allokutzneria albata]